MLKVGDLLAAKYRVERIIGEGGMGVVVAAHHELLDQRVAVKLLYQDIADREAQDRLVREARASARLRSIHVARVHDVDVGADGLPFIVMELLEGQDLCAVADEKGALPRWLVVDYILQTLEGLAHAHAQGIIHRDLKPSNLFLTNLEGGTQVLKILDFGISKSQEQGTPDRRAAQLTGGRAVLGSPPYMSPEQVRSPKSVDHRTDIWSLGVCMFELLTNSMPFGGDEIQETFAQILERSPTPIKHLVTGVPEGLEAVVMTCLSKNREERYSDVAALARALAPFGSGAWSESVTRIAATLARPVEEGASTQRLGNVPTSPGGEAPVAIPAAPAGWRFEANQPELHGTASTVGRRQSLLESKRHLTAVVGLSAALGVALIVGSVLLRSRRAASTDDTEPPPEVAAAIASQAPSSVVPSVEPPPSMPAVAEGTGASATAPPTGTIVAPQPSPSVAVVRSPPSRPPSAGAPAVRTKTGSPSAPSAPSARPGLPAGLPLTRQ